MSMLSVHYPQPLRPRPAAATAEARWSPVFATFFWSAVSAMVWSVIVGAGTALF